MASLEFRVQFVDDVDPFNVLASIKHAEPTVPKRYKFMGDVPLYDQVPGLKKHLRAPHKVTTSGSTAGSPLSRCVCVCVCVSVRVHVRPAQV